MTHLFLSPHLDDAVFSCGGRIHQLTQQGESVTILTITAGDPPSDLPDSPLLQDLHHRWQIGDSPVETRRREDIASAKVIGASAQHEAYCDCIYRQHQGKLLYPREESIFGDIHPDDLLPNQLTAQIPKFNQQFTDIMCVYVPLGVGHHVDHQIVRDWGIAIHKHNPELCVKFYEEYPYTRDKIALEKAQAIVNTRISLNLETVVLSEHDLNMKIESMACHQSQISTFWANHEAMADEIRTIFRADDTYIGDTTTYTERFWAIDNPHKGQAYGK